MNNKNKKVNIIGFNFQRPFTNNKTCVIHPGTVLIPKIDQPDMLWCPFCGQSYLDKESETTENITTPFGPHSNKSAIITSRKKKKYFDKLGNEITDPTLIQDIMQGATVISYEEDKPPATASHSSVKRL